MKLIEIKPENVYTLLNNAQWDYEISGSSVNEDKMANYINEIESNISEKLVYDLLEQSWDEIELKFEKGGKQSIEEFSAEFISDQVGQSLCNCIYDHVTFIALL